MTTTGSLFFDAPFPTASPRATTRVTSPRGEHPGRRDERQLGDLLAELASGRQDALGELYDRTRTLVFGIAHRILADAADAEEVALEVYAQVWRSAGSFDHRRGSVQAWLVVLARSRALDRLRAREVRRHLAADELSAVREPDANAQLPDAVAEHGELAARLRHLLQQLDPVERELVELAFFEGYTHSELAARLRMPLGTVKTRIRSSLHKLRAGLTEGSMATAFRRGPTRADPQDRTRRPLTPARPRNDRPWADHRAVV